MHYKTCKKVCHGGIAANTLPPYPCHQKLLSIDGPYMSLKDVNTCENTYSDANLELQGYGYNLDWRG